MRMYCRMPLVGIIKIHYDIYLMLIICAFSTAVYGNCLGFETPICLTDMEDSEANETLKYILSKYEEVDRKMPGELIGIRGKRITEGNKEELNIVFQYVDNTPYDVMQTCAFILRRQPGECETISTVCNSFLPITPRPLLKRDDLTVCEDEGGQEKQPPASTEAGS